MENEKLQPSSGRIAEELLDEEKEMERFFALVRSFKEMRDQRRKELMIGEEEEEKIAAEEKRRKRMKTTKAAELVESRSTWIPKFEREDFDEEFQALILPNPCCNLVKEDTMAATTTAAMKNKKRVKNGDDSLDLNLAL